MKMMALLIIRRIGLMSFKWGNGNGNGNDNGMNCVGKECCCCCCCVADGYVGDGEMGVNNII